MNVFSPYIVLKDSPSKLHLRETNLRENFNLIILRFLPFVYLFFAVFFIITKSKDVPAMVSVVMVGAIVIPALLIYSKVCFRSNRYKNGD
jgi:mannose/fructose/N-acetylgalactosamine-specific phosphotransferase system component IID